MGDHILSGNPPIALRLRHTARARRITLRVSALDGAITLTVPRGVPEREALKFAEEKEAWLRSHLEAQSSVVEVGLGVSLPIEGQIRQVLTGSGRRVTLMKDAVLVPGSEAQVPRRLLGFLKTLARLRLAEASDHFSVKLGLPYSRLSIRDTRSRWGSCTSQGALNYSWRLVLAPPDVLRYVAAHEVAHLAEMNHSQAFWNVVNDLFGPHDIQRQWLRKRGTDLHRIRFA